VAKLEHYEEAESSMASAFAPLHEDFARVLPLAVVSAENYLRDVHTGAVRPERASDAAADIRGPLPDVGVGALAAIRELSRAAAESTLRSSGPRFFHWATGGATPASVGADWLTAVYDQNARFWASSPLAVRLEQLALEWTRDLCTLPTGWTGTLTTGATMANFVGLACARDWWARRHGIDVAESGLSTVPPISVLAGERLHPTIFKAVAMLGMGRRCIRTLPSDESGGPSLDTLRAALQEGPAVVIATAGDANSGQFDPIARMAELCSRYGAWLHVDGAFGLMARVVPRTAHLLDGIEGACSVASDAHKWLNVPYDCGFVFVSESDALDRTFGGEAAFVGETGLDLAGRAPENSRRARALALWATLRAYGRNGYQTMIEGYLDLAQHLSTRVDAAPVLERLCAAPLNVVPFRIHPPNISESLLNDLNQMVSESILKEGRIYVGSMALFRGRLGFRPVIMNWRSTRADVDDLVDTILWHAGQLLQTDYSARCRRSSASK
jgi:glutamate/tyrosine decarboxylase-like PLP-dependent enzyme